MKPTTSNMQRWFKIFAVVTAVELVLFAGAYAFMRQPSLFTWRYELKIATGPIGSDGQKILAAFIREVAAERPIVRLVPVPTESLSASGKALIDGQVDLAVVRSDDAAAAQGRTVFILRRIGIAILLPPDSKTESVSELSGKKLAVIKAAHFDPALLKAFISFYGLRDSDLVELVLAGGRTRDEGKARGGGSCLWADRSRDNLGRVCGCAKELQG